MKNDEKENKNFKRISIIIGMICLLIIVNSLYRNSSTSILSRIESESNINFPNESRVINFHKKPPIDPIVIAKISIPKSSFEKMKEEISSKPDKKITRDGALLADSENVINWWKLDNIVVSRQYYYEGDFIVTVILTEENDEYFIYIECAVAF